MGARMQKEASNFWNVSETEVELYTVRNCKCDSKLRAYKYRVLIIVNATLNPEGGDYGEI